MPRSAVALARLAAPAAPATSDAQLLRAFTASQGDDAFAELVRRHGPMVLSVCQRVLSDTHDAEDAFQATFLVLARKAASVRGTNVAGWLYGVAVRTARGVRVMRDRRRRHEHAASAAAERQPSDGEPFADRDAARVIDEELAKLAEHHRDVLVVCELRGLSRKQAAAELGIPEGTLSSRLAAAKRKLAERLSARGLAGAVALAAALAPAAVPAALLESTALAVRGAAGGVAGAAASTVLKGMLFEQLRATVLAGAVLAAAVCGGLSMTGSAEAPPGKPAANAPRPVEDPAAALVRQLGSDDFAAREAAAKELRKLGLTAEPALKAGLKSDDPEVRARAAKLLAEVRKDALATLKTFDPTGDAEPDHPIWKRFKAVAGGDAPARKLFAELIADPRRLAVLDAADRDPEKAGDLYATELRRWYTHVQKLLDRPTTGTPGPKETPYPEAITVMYLGTYATSTGKAKEGWRWEGHLFVASWGDVMKSAVGPAARRVFVAWLARRDAPDTRERGLAVAAGYGVKEALPFARKVLADEKDVPEQRAQAALLLGLVGTRDDLALLRRAAGSKLANEPFIHFTVVLKGQQDLDALWGKYRFGVKVTPEDLERAKAADVRTCNRSVADCSWAAAVLLAGGRPEELGFLWPRTALGGTIDAGWFANVHIHGFPSDEARAAAHAKAKAFLDKQKEEPKKEEPKPDPAAAKLVGQLASDDFATREAAAKELRTLGPKAEAALKAGLASENAEVRARAAKILAEIRKGALDDLAKNFDPKADTQPDHPVWKRFKALAGDSRASRETFARVIANKKWLQTLDNAEANPAAAGHVYRVGLAEVFRDFHNDPAKTPPWPCDRPEEVAYLLFLGSYADAPTTKPAGDEIVPQNTRGVAFLGRGIIHGEGQITHAVGLEWGLGGKLWDTDKGGRAAVAGAEGTDRVFAKLLAAWLARRDPASEVVPRAFQRARAYRVAEALPVARRYAANDFEPKREVPPLATITALEVVAQFGTPADLPLFERHFGDETNVAAIDKRRDDGAMDYHRPAPLTDTTQMRDVALGLALLLHGGNPEDFGFLVRKDAFKQNDGRYAIPGLIQLHLGFKSEEDRAAAFKKAKTWLDEQKPKKEEPKKEEPKKEEPTAAKLVERLGGESFDEREAAAKELRKLGAKAVPALEAGRKSEDPEIRIRCAKVLAEIRQDALDELAKTFDPTSDAQPDHPLWNRFKAVAGNTLDSRFIFTQFLADRRLARVLDAAEANPAERARLYRDEVTRWSCDVLYAVADQMPGGQRLLAGGPKAAALKPPPEPVTTETLAAYFFLGSYPETAVVVPGKDRAGRPVREGMIVETWTFDKSNPQRQVIRTLFAAWLDNRVDRDALESAYGRATANDIPDAAPAARRLLAAEKLPSAAKAYAALYLARCGKPTDIALIKPLLDDKTVARAVIYDDKPAPVEVRDAALAACLLLSGENPADCGFDVLRKRGSPKADAYDMAWLGFWSDESRAAAHKEAREWLDGRK